MRHRRPHHPRRWLRELPGVVSLGGWRREAAEEEEGGRQGREVGVRVVFDSVLTFRRLIFQLRSRRRHHPCSRRRSPGYSLRPGKLLLPGLGLLGWPEWRGCRRGRGWRQGRQLGVRGLDALDSVLTSRCPIFESASGASVSIQPPEPPGGAQGVLLV